MDVQWWRLPGPTRFLQLVIQDLRAGKNLVIVFPSFAPDGFREELSQRVRENDLWRWRAMCASELPSDGAANLTASLHSRLLPASSVSGPITALSLAKKLVGTVIWVENANGPAWQAWSRFLAQYQHACQTCDPFERSLFCLSTIGTRTPPIVADTALSVRHWKAIVGPLDMTLYVDRALSAKFVHPLHYKVARSVVTELAGTDVHLAHYLLKHDLGAILEPFEILRTFALTRGWTAQTRCSEDGLDGTSDVVDHVKVVHSAVIAARGDRAELRRRVWRGQVVSLFPFIEEQRIRIISDVCPYLRFPLDTTYGRVENAEDLELGQLQYFLRGKKVPPLLWRRLSILTEMRHAIAHLEPVSIGWLFADEILSLDN